jgi:hypothetical protein
MAKENDLKVLTESLAESVTLSTGSVIVINQIKVRQLPAFGKIIKSIFPDGVAAIANFDDIKVPDLILTHAAEIIDLIKLCTGVDDDTIDALDISCRQSGRGQH